jgi:hypothetical protein
LLGGIDEKAHDLRVGQLEADAGQEERPQEQDAQALWI